MKIPIQSLEVAVLIVRPKFKLVSKRKTNGQNSKQKLIKNKNQLKQQLHKITKLKVMEVIKAQQFNYLKSEEIKD